MVADIEVDMVSYMEAEKMTRLTWKWTWRLTRMLSWSRGLVNWAKSFSTWSLPPGSRVYFTDKQTEFSTCRLDPFGCLCAQKTWAYIMFHDLPWIVFYWHVQFQLVCMWWEMWDLPLQDFRECLWHPHVGWSCTDAAGQVLCCWDRWMYYSKLLGKK